MQRRALVLEAQHTTHIEGTHLTLDQSERLLAGEKPAGVGADDAKEVANYREAFELVSDYLGSGDPITEGPVREIHRRLVQGVWGNAAAPCMGLDDSMAIQSVRERDMDLTDWLEYFTIGLSSQLAAVRKKGEW